MRSMTSVFSGRRAAAFACGTVAGLVAGRLLPPLSAAAAGSARAAAGGDPFDPLIADHRKFIALLQDMEDSPSSATLRRIQLLLRLKRRLAAHAMAEEDVIYPLLADEAKAAEDAKHLYGDHAEMKMLLHHLEQSPKDAPAWAGLARDLRTVIAEHARQEEDVHFPALAKALDRAATIRLSRNLHREKALIL